MLKAHAHNLPVWYSAQASRFVRQSPIHCSNAFTSKHCSVSPDCLLLQTGWCCGYSPVLPGKGSTAWGCLHQKPLGSRLAMKVTHRIRAYQITWDHLGITMSCNLCKGTVRFSDFFSHFCSWGWLHELLWIGLGEAWQQLCVQTSRSCQSSLELHGDLVESQHFMSSHDMSYMS